MKLFDEHIWLVEKIVNRMNFGYISKEDLMQAGLMGLFYAAQRFNETLGVKFNTFATYYIIGEVKRELRNNKLIKLNREYYKIIREIKKTDNYTPERIAKRLNVSREKVIIAYSYLYDTISLNQKRSNESDKERELLDEIPAKGRRTYLTDAVDCLEQFEKEIIDLRYFKNYSQTEIAKIKSISQSKISRTENRALKKMRNFLLHKSNHKNVYTNFKV